MPATKRLRKLGVETFDQYLRTPTWLLWSADYLIRHDDAKCFVCYQGKDDVPLFLFHKSETSAGRESDEDVTPLCQVCLAFVVKRIKSGTMRHNAHIAVARESSWLRK